MAIEKLEGGGMVITGEHINVFRQLTLWSGLKLECKGSRLSRGRSCYSIVKQERGFKGNKARVRDQFEAWLRQNGMLKPEE
jgi:hypothetical protein